MVGHFKDFLKYESYNVKIFMGLPTLRDLISLTA